MTGAETRRATTIGERMRQVRRQRGLTQAALAELAEMSTTTVSRIERGCLVPHQHTVQHLATALDISMWWLILGDDTDSFLP